MTDCNGKRETNLSKMPKRFAATNVKQKNYFQDMKVAFLYGFGCELFVFQILINGFWRHD
jgi:hypothetical protein